MSRLEAIERVAHGVACDDPGCDVIVPVRNAASSATGYWVRAGGLVRVTEAGNRHTNADDLFFCTKEHLLHAVEYGLSRLTGEAT